MKLNDDLAHRIQVVVALLFAVILGGCAALGIDNDTLNYDRYNNKFSSEPLIDRTAFEPIELPNLIDPHFKE